VFGESLSPSGRAIIAETVTAAEGRGSATITGIVVLLWGAGRLFRALDLAFDRLYGTREDATVRGTVRDVTVVVFGLVAGGGVLFGATIVAAMVDLPTGLRFLGVPLALFTLFVPFYVGFPDRRVSVRAAAPGAALAALGWSVLGAAVQLYATVASDVAIYGLLGGLLVFVTWLYIANLLLLLGAGTNVVLSGERPT